MTNGERPLGYQRQRLAKIGYEKWRTQTEQIWPTWESLDELRREHWVEIARAMFVAIISTPVMDEIAEELKLTATGRCDTI